LLRGRERKTVAKVVERVETRYEIQNVEVGKVYSWCPESVLIECGCDETLALNVYRSTCGKRGANHTAISEELLEQIARSIRSIIPRVLRAHTRGA
jgi:hypothetical protein